MLKHKTDIRPRDVTLVPKSIRIYASEDIAPLVLEIPSASELETFRDGFSGKISVPELSDVDHFGIFTNYQNDKERLLKRYEKFKYSTTYLVNLANIVEMTGDTEGALAYLQQAEKTNESEYIKHRIGDNLAGRGKTEKAIEIFSNLDLNGDIYAMLRMAYFSTVNNELILAEKHLLNAIELEPDNYSVRMFYGALCLSKGNFPLAIRNFRVALDTRPLSPVALVNIAASYWGVGEKTKAFHSLSLAVEIDPFNDNAVSFYADAAHILGKDSRCINALIKYLDFDQKKEHIWALLGRAHYVVSLPDKNKNHLTKALEALKHQESMSSTSSVWNNIGVVTWSMRNHDAAVRYLNFALKKSVQESSDASLPLYNINGILIEQGDFGAALKYINNFSEIAGRLMKSQKYADKIKLQHVVALEGLEKREEAVRLAKETYTLGVLHEEVKIDLLIRIVYYHTTHEPNIEIINTYKTEILQLIKSSERIESNLKYRAINNLAFAYLNFNQVDEANKLILQMGPNIHADAYSTATLGMYQIKKGNLEKGVNFYRESIAMLGDKKSKDRFRQRLNLELGKYYLERGDSRKALRYLEKSRLEKNGFSYVSREIQDLTKRIKQ